MSYQVKSPEDVFVNLRQFFHGEEKEQLAAMFLNSRNNILGMKVIGSGNFELMDSKSLLDEASKVSAKDIILAHNHLTKDLTPSREEIRT